jgi:uncharacterized protein (TIGR02646 family)
MLQLASNQTLSAATIQKLADLQALIDAETFFAAKAEKAKSLWNSKPKNEFTEVKAKLLELCVSVEICNYCEQNEANDIEHIDPKSFFPEKAFKWENYLLACKQCNSAYKLDQCFVIDANGDLHITTRGQEPLFKINALINARTENPSDFMILNMQDFTFDILEDLPQSDQHKAEKTIQILALNERDALKHGRKNISTYIYQRLDLLVKILAATSTQEIETLLTPNDDYLDKTQSLENQKEIIKNGFKNDILTQAHPSVWYAIKMVESKVNTKWQAIFTALPEIANW